MPVEPGGPGAFAGPARAPRGALTGRRRGARGVHNPCTGRAQGVHRERGMRGAARALTRLPRVRHGGPKVNPPTPAAAPFGRRSRPGSVPRCGGPGRRGAGWWRGDGAGVPPAGAAVHRRGGAPSGGGRRAGSPLAAPGHGSGASGVRRAPRSCRRQDVSAGRAECGRQSRTCAPRGGSCGPCPGLRVEGVARGKAAGGAVPVRAVREGLVVVPEEWLGPAVHRQRWARGADCGKRGTSHLAGRSATSRRGASPATRHPAGRNPENRG
jgi:hypothetical protein